MKRHKTLLMLISCAALAWGGEAGMKVVGAAHNSQLARDLKATRKGDKVTLTWKQPRAVANSQSVAANLMVARICRTILPAAPTPATVSDASTVCAQTVGQVDLRKPAEPGVRAVHGKGSAEATVQFIDTLPAARQGSDALQFAVYRVELRDHNGRRAGVSNAASVPLAPILPAKGLHSELDVHGVYLIWENEIESPSSSFKFDYRIYRSEKGSSNRAAIPFLRGVIHTKEGERWSGVDTNIEWEKTYSYSVIPVTRVYSQDGQLIGEIEGDEPAPLEVTTHDVFPPAAPERLLAMVTQAYGKRFVDLLWAPSAEKNVSGYNVYRREENGEATRINSVPMTMLSFQDTEVAGAHTYLYSISAVDKHGHESARSQEATAVLH